MTMSQIIRNLNILSEKDIQRKNTHMRQNKYIIKDVSKENIKLKHAWKKKGLKVWKKGLLKIQS